MITKVESYNANRNINFTGKPSQRVIEEIQKVGAKKMESIVRDASKSGIAVDENSLKDVQKWVNSQIRAIKKYMKGFHEDITLDYSDNWHRWWIFRNKNFSEDVSYTMDWSIDAFDAKKIEGRNIGWLIEYITPEYIHNKMLSELIHTAEYKARNGNGTVASTREAIDAASRWAHQIKDPSGYKKTIKPIVDNYRRKRAAQLRAEKIHNKFFKINRDIQEPYRERLSDLIDFNKRYSTTYFTELGSSEIWGMAEAAIKARKKLHKADLEKYVAKMKENINSMDDYIKSFSEEIYIGRDKKLPNAPWEFRMHGHYSKPIVIKKPVTPKPEGELFINTITEDIKELKLNKPEDIEKELFDACLQRGLEKTKTITYDSFAQYQDWNITLLSQIKELAKRTHQEKKYQQFLESIQEIIAPRETVKNTQAANEALLAQYTKGLIK